MPQGRKGAFGGAKASQHFSMCSCCQVSQQIIAVLCVAPTFSARHHACACCPLFLAHWLPTASLGPHSRNPSHASAFQHVTTCRACGSGALRRPGFSPLDCSVFSPLDCSVLSWRPIHPGQLEPTTLPLRRLAPVSCSVGLSPTLSLPISLALSCSLSFFPLSLSLLSAAPLSVPFPLCPTPPPLSLSLSLSFSVSLSLSLSLPLAQKRGFGSFVVSLSPPGFEPSSTGQKRCDVSTGPRQLGICTMRSNLSLLCVTPCHAYLLSHGGVFSSV